SDPPLQNARAGPQPPRPLRPHCARPPPPQAGQDRRRLLLAAQALARIERSAQSELRCWRRRRDRPACSPIHVCQEGARDCVMTIARKEMGGGVSANQSPDFTALNPDYACCFARLAIFLARGEWAWPSRYQDRRYSINLNMSEFLAASDGGGVMEA